MGLKKLIAQLTESNKELSDSVKATLDVDKIKKYEELKTVTADLPRLKVKNTRMVFDDKTGKFGVEVIYDFPSTVMWLDEDKKFVGTKEFKAINEIGLLSVKECEKIRKAMEDIKHESIR